jgi:hypothetical protein
LSACTSGELIDGGLCAKQMLLENNKTENIESERFISTVCLFEKQLGRFCKKYFCIHPGMAAAGNKALVIYFFRREIV